MVYALIDQKRGKAQLCEPIRCRIYQNFNFINNKGGMK